MKASRGAREWAVEISAEAEASPKRRGLGMCSKRRIS